MGRMPFPSFRFLCDPYAEYFARPAPCRFTSVQVMVWLRNNNFVEVAQALDIEQRTTGAYPSVV